MSALPQEVDDIGNVSNVKVVNTGIIPLFSKLDGYIRVVSPNNNSITISDSENELLLQKINRITPVVYLNTLRKILVDIRKYLTFESPSTFASKSKKISIINNFIQSINATRGDITPENIVLLIESYLKGLNTLYGLEGGKRRKTKYNRKHKYSRFTKKSRKHSRSKK